MPRRRPGVVNEGAAYPRRLTLDLSNEDHAALRREAFEHEVPMSETIRQLIAVWRADPKLQGKVRAAAIQVLSQGQPPR